MDISAETEKLVTKYRTRDPFELSAALGAEVVFADLGSLKGMYTVIKRNRFIVINQSLTDPMRKIVCAHELGHDRLHRGMAMDSAFKETSVYDMSLRPEREANIFAATLLIDKNEMLSLIMDGHDASSAAAALKTDVDLLMIRAEELLNSGENISVPFCTRGDFLRK